MVKQIFDEVNLALFRPRKDRSDVCVGYGRGNIEEQDWAKHRELKDAP